MEDIKEIDWRIIVIGLLCLTTLEIIAICHGHNGIILSSVIAIIGLVIGVILPNPIKK